MLSLMHYHSITIPPLLPILLCFITGILYQSDTISLPASIVTLAFICIFLMISRHQYWQWYTHIIIYCLSTIAGVSTHLYHTHMYQKPHNIIYNTSVDCIGTIEDIYCTTISKRKTYAINFSLQSIQHNNQSISVSPAQTILIYTSNNQQLDISDTICCHNIVIKKTKNESLMLYQMRQNIKETIFVPHLNYTILDRPKHSIKRSIAHIKNNILHTCEKKLTKTTFLFFSSLFLGNKTYIKDKFHHTYNQFLHWGILHFLARSGLHLAIFITMWQSIFRFICISITIKNFLLILLCLIYDLFSWSSIPFFRSLMLFLIHKLCLTTRLSYNLFHYLTATCFSLLLYCPFYLFFLDFQLTFGITFALAWFYSLIHKYSAE